MKPRPSTPSVFPTSSLEKETLAAFTAWRRSAPFGLRRMSDSLWGAAVRLAVATSVYRASRLLRLDFSQLKKRVLTSSEGVQTTSPKAGDDFPAGNSPVIWQEKPSRKPIQSAARQASSQHAPELAIPSVSSHGFMEVSALSGIASGPQPLAEIRSPAGYTLRLFSVEASRIIEAFMQS